MADLLRARGSKSDDRPGHHRWSHSPHPKCCKGSSWNKLLGLIFNNKTVYNSIQQHIYIYKTIINPIKAYKGPMPHVWCFFPTWKSYLSAGLPWVSLVWWLFPAASHRLASSEASHRHPDWRLKYPSWNTHFLRHWGIMLPIFGGKIATKYVKRVKRENIRTAGDDQQNSFDL